MWRPALALVMAAALLFPAAAEANEASLRTISLLSYHRADGKLIPSRSFSGVVLNGRYVVTSRWALGQGHSNPFVGYQAELAEVRGVVRDGEDWLEVELSVWESPRMTTDELVLLEVQAADREALAAMIPYLPELGSLEGGTSGRLLGVPAPLGPDEVNLRTIPPPLELTITWEEALRNRGTLAAPGEPTYPPQMVGAGVWSPEQALLGILVREDRGWWIVDGSVVEELGKLAGLDWDAPEGFAAFGGGELRRPAPRPRNEIRGIYELLDRNGLQMRLDRNLVDWVNQPQADLIMAMIAGGEYGRALGLLDRIEPLVANGGRLTEQMRYRRGLALILSGDNEAAREALSDAEQMRDELTRARARLLWEVLEAEREGRLDDVVLSDPERLVQACLMTLAELEDAFAASLEQTRRRVGMAPVELVLVDLERTARDVRDFRLAWPGYFDPMLDRIDEIRDDLVPSANR